ncbi:hypothetical protein BSKO_10641 [Bryopsis sp. KO-2023]|nr:hypothetical protein BSKO_10641 [Bryopsis sp. KO-2023]
MEPPRQPRGLRNEERRPQNETNHVDDNARQDADQQPQQDRQRQQPPAIELADVIHEVRQIELAEAINREQQQQRRAIDLGHVIQRAELARRNPRRIHEYPGDEPPQDEAPR